MPKHLIVSSPEALPVILKRRRRNRRSVKSRMPPHIGWQASTQITHRRIRPIVVALLSDRAISLRRRRWRVVNRMRASR